MYTRELRPPAAGKSWFLFGPRQTGKSTLVRSLLEDRDLYFDLLPQRTFLSYLKRPGRLRDEILAHHRRHRSFLCVIDEIQKIPGLLDEAHELIESLGLAFVMTGSSARKLVRGGANLLAGRAYVHRMFPLTPVEIGAGFDLEKALVHGTLPALWNPGKEDAAEFLRAYSDSYLREEILQEGVVRQIGPFSQFLDIMAATDGETTNFSAIARECAVSVKTVQQYYRILEDTFLATRIPAWTRTLRRRLVSHPRFYLFDPGVANALAHTLDESLNPVVRGRRFEQFVINQIVASIHYRRLDRQLYYWRTNHGLEVDLLICKGERILAACEIKSSRSPGRQDLDGLDGFLSEHAQVPGFVLGIEQRERAIGERITVVSWDRFIYDKLPRLR